MSSAVARLGYVVLEPAKAHVRALWKSRQVHEVRISPGLADARIVAVLVVKDEAPRLSALMDHHRALGVDHFIVIDNESSDGTRQLLTGFPDVSIYSATGSFGRARYGYDWVNHVLGRRCVGKWVLYLDADEFFVFDSATGRLPDVCDLLEASGVDSVQALMLDMYSARRAGENLVAVGQHPLEVCDLFDPTGYRSEYDATSATTWIKGGVRGRVFFEDSWDGPALNKTPLIRWRRHYALLRATHLLWPARLNGAGARPYAALLHFKFTSSNTARMVSAEYRAEHTQEYEAYDGVDQTVLVSPGTAVYSRPADLVEHGLIASLEAGPDGTLVPERRVG